MAVIQRENVIESDEGFCIEILGRTGLHFTEKTKTYYVDSELLAGPSGLVVYKDNIRLLAQSSSNKAVDRHTVNDIVEKVRRAFRCLGFEIEVI